MADVPLLFESGFDFGAEQVLLVATSPGVVAQNYVLDSDTWARPRSAREVAMMPSVKQLVQRWMQIEDGRVEIRYPGGEEGSLWASELRDWLVTLGVPSGKIVLRVGSPNADELVLSVLS